MDHQYNTLYQNRPSVPLVNGYMRPTEAIYQTQILYSPVKLENVNCIVEQTDNLGGLYLGDVISSKKQELLRKHNIKAVLSCAIEAIYNPKDTPNYQVDATKVILAQDLYTYDISKHFEEAYQFIDEQVQLGKNVLVHCHAGVSRSAALLAAYLIKSRQLTVDQAISLIRSKRARAKPNDAFLLQLKEFADKHPAHSQIDGLYDASPKPSQPKPIEAPLSEKPQNKIHQLSKEKKKLSVARQTFSKEKKDIKSIEKKDTSERLQSIDKKVEVRCSENNNFQTPKKKEPTYLEPEFVTLKPSYRQQPQLQPVPNYINNTYPYKKEYPLNYQRIVQSPPKPKFDPQAFVAYEQERRKALCGFFNNPNPQTHIAHNNSRAEKIGHQTMNMMSGSSASTSNQARPVTYYKTNGFNDSSRKAPARFSEGADNYLRSYPISGNTYKPY